MIPIKYNFISDPTILDYDVAILESWNRFKKTHWWKNHTIVWYFEV